MSWITPIILLQTVCSNWRLCALSAVTATIPAITTGDRIRKVSVSDSIVAFYVHNVDLTDENHAGSYCFYTAQWFLCTADVFKHFAFSSYTTCEELLQP